MNHVTFLCGRIESIKTDGKYSAIRIRGSDWHHVPSSDKGLLKIAEGRRRMIVFKDGAICAVYGRPRIKLIRKLAEGDNHIDEETLLGFRPMYFW